MKALQKKEGRPAQGAIDHDADVISTCPTPTLEVCFRSQESKDTPLPIEGGEGVDE